MRSKMTRVNFSNSLLLTLSFTNEPTHFVGNSRSCIDDIFTDQPNLFLESGVRVLVVSLALHLSTKNFPCLA